MDLVVRQPHYLIARMPSVKRQRHPRRLALVTSGGAYSWNGLIR